jgi:hypothetical protein
MKNGRFRVNGRALIGYDSLTEAERGALDRALLPLVNLPEARWTAVGAIRLELKEPLYVVRVDDSLRALVSPADGGRPELVDLVRQEFLQRYFRSVG